jgi:hypothetical protein
MRTSFTSIFFYYTRYSGKVSSGYGKKIEISKKTAKFRGKPLDIIPSISVCLQSIRVGNTKIDV